MNFNHFTAKTDIFSKKCLQGKSSHLKMIPEQRINILNKITPKQKPKEAGVLALFFPNQHNETCFVLTERASYKGTHSAQISFPGGKKENTDLDLKQTALRESEEEIGIIKNEIQIFKELTQTYIPPSNFMVSPFLGISTITPSFNTNYEVANLIVVKLDDLLNNDSISSITLNTSYKNNITVPCFKLNNYIVWGATAMILSEIKDLIK